MPKKRHHPKHGSLESSSASSKKNLRASSHPKRICPLSNYNTETNQGYSDGGAPISMRRASARNKANAHFGKRDSVYFTPKSCRENRLALHRSSGRSRLVRLASRATPPAFSRIPMRTCAAREATNASMAPIIAERMHTRYVLKITVSYLVHLPT